MSYSYKELRELIPLYLNRRLSEKEERELEEGLSRFPELKQELMEFLEIKEIYREMEKDLPLPSDHLYEKVLRRIKRESRISLTSLQGGYIGRMHRSLGVLLGSPRLAWGVVVVQIAILLFLVFHFREGDRFKTLTSGDRLLEGRSRINIVFEEGSKEREIREVLNQVGAVLVGGPSREGLYVVEVKEGQEVERVIDKLRQTRVVRFAERVP